MRTASKGKVSDLITPTSKNVIGTFKGVLGPRNSRDDYTLTVTRQGVFSASLTGLRNNAALQLRADNGRVIAKSNRPGRRSELIRRTLSPGTYFVQVSRSGGRTRYTLSLSDNSGNSPPTPVDPLPAPVDPLPVPVDPPPTTVNPFQNLWGTYRGIGSTTIGTIDPLSGQLTSANTFQTTIVTEVSLPKAAAGIVESNPFNLSVNSSPAEIMANTEGAISVFSAIPFNFQGGFLLQYWNLQYSGNQISGTLINRDSGAALTANLFNSTMNLGFGFTVPFPYAMDTGTTLQGTLTPTEMRIKIQGLDSGRTRAFISDILVQRV